MGTGRTHSCSTGPPILKDPDLLNSPAYDPQGWQLPRVNGRLINGKRSNRKMEAMFAYRTTAATKRDILADPGRGSRTRVR